MTQSSLKVRPPGIGQECITGSLREVCVVEERTDLREDFFGDLTHGSSVSRWSRPLR